MDKEQLAEKYRKMGIPMPISQAEMNESANVRRGGNKDMLSKIEMIRKGAKKNDFKSIIQKVEGGGIVNKNIHQDIPVSKPGQKGQNGQNVKTVAVENYRPEGGSSEALEAERIMFGGSSSVPERVVSQPQQTAHGVQPSIDENYGPPVDWRQKIQDRFKVDVISDLPSKHNQPVESTRQEGFLNNSVMQKKLNELENRMQDMAIEVAEQMAVKVVNEMVAEIATEVSRKTAIETTKKIILEFGKAGKQILVETSKVKKAEIISKDKVKIEGKIYKLTEVKE